MKKANKFLASTLAFTMALTAVAPISAFAADSDKTIQVSQNFVEEFVLTIPDGTESLEEGQSFELSAYAYLEKGNELVVSVTSENGWRLTDAKYAENSKSLAYEMMLDGEVLTEKTEEVLAVPYNAVNYTAKSSLVVKSVAAPDYAGTYEDVLTFTTAVRSMNETTKATQAANVIAAPDSREILMDFYNTDDNEKIALCFEIRMEDESEQGYEVLYRSGLVDSGLHIRNDYMSRGLEAGTYDAVVYIMAYNMDGTKVFDNGVVVIDGGQAVDEGIEVPIKILVDEAAYNSAQTPIAVTRTFAAETNGSQAGVEGIETIIHKSTALHEGGAGGN